MLVCTGDMESLMEDASWIELASIEVAEHTSTHSSLLVASNPQIDLLTVHRANPETLPTFSITNEGGATFSGKIEIVAIKAFSETFFQAKEEHMSLAQGETKVLSPELTANSSLYTNAELFPDGIYYIVIREQGFWDPIDLFGDYYYRIRLITDLSSSDIAGKDVSTIVLYPNPAHDYVHVAIPPTYAGSTLRLFDIQGRMQLSTKIESADMRLDVERLPKGTYIVVVEDMVGKLFIR